jgi:hypothetical protein
MSPPFIVFDDSDGVWMVEPQGPEPAPPSVGKAFGLISVFWLGVGLFGGTADFLARRADLEPISWIQATTFPLLVSILWIPISLSILWVGGRYPPASLTPRFRIKPQPAVLHGMGSLGVGFVLNGTFFAILVASGVTPSSEYWDLTMETALRFLHINAGVYWVILALAHLPALLASRNTALKRVANQEAFQETLTVRSGNQSILVRVSDIRWIEGAGDYVRLHLGLANHLHSERLKRLETRLDPDRFVRVHRSAIVNVEAVRKLRHLGHGDYEAVLEGGSTVRVSRTRRSQLTGVLDKREVGEEIP